MYRVTWRGHSFPSLRWQALLLPLLAGRLGPDIYNCNVQTGNEEADNWWKPLIHINKLQYNFLNEVASWQCQARKKCVRLHTIRAFQVLRQQHHMILNHTTLWCAWCSFNEGIHLHLKAYKLTANGFSSKADISASSPASHWQLFSVTERKGWALESN